jgi:hypothetical protein
MLAMLIGFIVVEYLAHRFAEHHPEFGPARKLGCGGCGNHCEGHCKSSEH